MRIVVIGTGHVGLVTWPVYRTLDLDALEAVMAYPFVVDARNIYDRKVMREQGFVYRPTGRPNVDAFRANVSP